MERSYPLQSATFDRSLLLSALLGAGEAIRLWQRRRRTAKVVGQLSAEQLQDGGIETPELNIPCLEEMPTGLIQELMSMR